MPLAISIAMALSINRLKKDNILIKNLEAVQTCAMLHDLCVSKTGTITSGELKVKKFHFINEEKSKENFPAQICFFIEELKIRKELKDLIVSSIIGNCDVTLAINEETLKYEP